MLLRQCPPVRGQRIPELASEFWLNIRASCTPATRWRRCCVRVCSLGALRIATILPIEQHGARRRRERALRRQAWPPVALTGTMGARMRARSASIIRIRSSLTSDRGVSGSPLATATAPRRGVVGDLYPLVFKLTVRASFEILKSGDKKRPSQCSRLRRPADLMPGGASNVHLVEVFSCLQISSHSRSPYACRLT
jgi:hypothetical protein